MKGEGNPGGGRRLKPRGLGDEQESPTLSDAKRLLKGRAEPRRREGKSSRTLVTRQKKARKRIGRCVRTVQRSDEIIRKVRSGPFADP